MKNHVWIAFGDTLLPYRILLREKAVTDSEVQNVIRVFSVVSFRVLFDIVLVTGQCMF